MKDWYSARNLAELPGMPATKWGVCKKAAREAWPFREVKGKGGTRHEYPLTALPEETQAHLRAQNTALAPAIVVEENSLVAHLRLARHRLYQVLVTLDELEETLEK